MVKLTHCVGLRSRDAVSEISVKVGESLLRQKPPVGSVELQSKAALGLNRYINQTSQLVLG
jgi:hypothetical protein